MLLRPLASYAAILAMLAGCSAASDVSGPTIHVSGAFTTFASLTDMASASSMVFLGSVVEVTDGRFDPAPPGEDFKGYQDLEVIIRVDEPIRGGVKVGDTVTIPWFGYVVNSDGTKGAQQIVENQIPPVVGDSNLWFLGEGDGGTFGLIAFEGRLEVDASGQLILGEGLVSGAADEISGITLTELKELIGQS